MFKIGKVTNYYEKIGITIVKLSGNLISGDKIKIYKDGQLVLFQQVDNIFMNQKDIPFAKSGDVVGLHFVIGLDENDEKISKGSEIYRQSELGT